MSGVTVIEFEMAYFQTSRRLFVLENRHSARCYPHYLVPSIRNLFAVGRRKDVLSFRNRKRPDCCSRKNQQQALCPYLAKLTI
jgi:hypothetical protein